MSTATDFPSTIAAAPSAAPCVASPHLRRPRDVRLDFFRGLAMFVIFVSHVPWNSWANVLPGRFGFSDATEVFVFCSGIASAIAFGRVFDERGALAGTTRVVMRVWQVYWAHLGMFLIGAAMLAGVDLALRTEGHYFTQAGMHGFFVGDTPTHLIALLTLTYVPALFNILPMYIVMLALIPVVMLAERHGGRAAAGALVIGMWVIGTTGLVDFPEAPNSTSSWFFNPFAWQLLFFTGFAFARGWLPVPPVDKRLIIAALSVVIVLMPFAFAPLVDSVDVLRNGNQALWPVVSKTYFRPLRLLHFLSVAYLAWVAVGVSGQHLKGPVVAVVCKVGQQALPTFMAGVILSLAAGIVLDLIGRDFVRTSLVNMAGIGLLVATAYVAAYFKAGGELRRPVEQDAAVRAKPASSPADTSTTAPLPFGVRFNWSAVFNGRADFTRMAGGGAER
ncbi:MAG: OpgC domain-containing protein [Hyphomicrobiaceae bacterium]|nr:OpgC domain-containing protein [Hyphomicrobiaceae bacterium]